MDMHKGDIQCLAIRAQAAYSSKCHQLIDIKNNGDAPMSFMLNASVLAQREQLPQMYGRVDFSAVPER